MNVNEDAIIIEVALLLRPDYFSRFIIVPLLSLLTLLIFPLKMYWSKSMQVSWLYKRAGHLDQATNVFVMSKDEHAEIVKLKKMNADVLPLIENQNYYLENPLLIFEYRFIRF